MSKSLAVRKLNTLGACNDAIRWASRKRKTANTPETLWNICEQPSWMVWLLDVMTDAVPAKMKPLVNAQDLLAITDHRVHALMPEVLSIAEHQKLYQWLLDARRRKVDPKLVDPTVGERDALRRAMNEVPGGNIQQAFWELLRNIDHWNAYSYEPHLNVANVLSGASLEMCATVRAVFPWTRLKPYVDAIK